MPPAFFDKLDLVDSTFESAVYMGSLLFRNVFYSLFLIAVLILPLKLKFILLLVIICGLIDLALYWVKYVTVQ